MIFVCFFLYMQEFDKQTTQPINNHPVTSARRRKGRDYWLFGRSKNSKYEMYKRTQEKDWPVLCDLKNSTFGRWTEGPDDHKNDYLPARRRILHFPKTSPQRRRRLDIGNWNKATFKNICPYGNAKLVKSIFKRREDSKQAKNLNGRSCQEILKTAE